jgi:hypothetical protein
LHEELQKVGLSINISKTKEIQANVRNNKEIKLQDNVVERVDRFTYLGSTVTKNSGTEEDVLNRISRATTAFVQLYSIWKNKQITQRTKLRISETNVKAILLYGCETWKITQTIVSKLQTFINRCLRKICNIHWPQIVTNEELWKKTKQEKIEKQIKKRKWKWIGYTLRKEGTVERDAPDWNPQGYRRRGRPQETWRRTVIRDLEEKGKHWSEIKELARNRI